MTPDEYAAKRRAYDHARYIAQREERTAKARDRYHTSPQYRATKCAYSRGYQAGMRKATKVAAESFADFTQPSTTTEQ